MFCDKIAYGGKFDDIVRTDWFSSYSARLSFADVSYLKKFENELWTDEN
jgi:hypothetical protein